MGCLNIMQNRPDNRIYAGFFVRLAAYIVDIIIVWAAMLIVRIPVWITTVASPDNFLVKDFIFQYSIKDILFYLMQVAYFILLTYFTGSTLGKKLFQIRVVSAEDRKMTFFEVTFRETVGRFLSALILSVGYIMIAIDKKKRGLHDILSDTNVVYYHEKKVYTHADVHYRNMVDSNVQGSQSHNPYEKSAGQSQNINPYEKSEIQSQNLYGEAKQQPQSSLYEDRKQQSQNVDTNEEVSETILTDIEKPQMKTIQPQNMPSGYFADSDKTDEKSTLNDDLK